MRYRVIYFQCLCYLALPLCIGLVSMHLIRCVLWHVVCIFFLSFFFKFLVFGATIYANKDVYIISYDDLWRHTHVIRAGPQNVIIRNESVKQSNKYGPQ